jgi:hypothetical protein
MAMSFKSDLFSAGSTSVVRLLTSAPNSLQYPWGTKNDDHSPPRIADSGDLLSPATMASELACDARLAAMAALNQC